MEQLRDHRRTPGAEGHGDMHTFTACVSLRQAWALIEGGLHRALGSYVLNRFNRTQKCRQVTQFFSGPIKS